MDVILKKIYNHEDSFLVDYALPSLFLLIFTIIITMYYIKANLYESKVDWSINKCVPKYMFVSGYIHRESGKNALSAIYDNFASCVKQYKNTPYVPPPAPEVSLNAWNIFKKKFLV
jgi:hypothetical protein